MVPKLCTEVSGVLQRPHRPGATGPSKGNGDAAMRAAAVRSCRFHVGPGHTLLTSDHSRAGSGEAGPANEHRMEVTAMETSGSVQSQHSATHVQ